jgi:hypothetical protein
MKIKKNLFVILLFALGNNVVFAQKLPDPTTRKMSRIELADYYNQKSKRNKTLGYGLLGGGALLVIVGTALAVDDIFSNNNNAGFGVATFMIGGASMIASWPVLASGAKHKGRAEMLYMNPDPSKTDDMATMYKRKARTNKIIAWALVGNAILLPIILPNDNINATQSTISTIAVLGGFASIPFFMEAAKNKGRVSILSRMEHVPMSYLNGSGTHRSIGLAFPIGN